MVSQQRVNKFSAESFIRGYSRAFLDTLVKAFWIITLELFIFVYGELFLIDLFRRREYLLDVSVFP